MVKDEHLDVAAHLIQRSIKQGEDPRGELDRLCKMVR